MASTAVQKERPQSLLKRLVKDVEEIKSNPYPGIEIFPHDENYTKLCLVLTPQSGPFTGLRLHFMMEIPSDWPNSPPEVAINAHIDHPNVFGGWGLGNGGAYICCDLLKSHNYEHIPGSSYKGGYTAAYPLQTICMQLLSFFSVQKVEQMGGGYFVDMHGELVTQYLEGGVWEDHQLRSVCQNVDYPNVDAKAEEAFARHSNSVIKEYKNITDYSGEVPSSLPKAGSWDPTLGGTVQGEIEIKRLNLAAQKESGIKVFRIRHRNPRWLKALHQIKRWTCKQCNYNEDSNGFIDKALATTLKELCRRADGRSSAPSSVTNVSTHMLNGVPTITSLEMLNDDVLLMIANQLSSESLFSLMDAYPRFKTLADATRIKLLRELTCFFLRVNINSLTEYKGTGRTILGIGIHLDPYKKELQSAFDWISMEAVDQFKACKSTDQSSFEYFLPLAFSQPHYQRAKRHIWERLVKIHKETSYQGYRAPEYTRGNRKLASMSPTLSPESASIQVIYKLMNNTVVQFMRSTEGLYDNGSKSASTQVALLRASEKSVTAYCQLFHLLLCLVRDRPEIRQAAFVSVKYFFDSVAGRKKDVVPDLGELIVQVCLVNATANEKHKGFSWPNELVGPFLEETFTRNVRWVLKDYPELEVLENMDSKYRRQKTFQSSRTSLRLLMFQTYFLRFFVSNIVKYPHDLGNNYGFPPAGVAEIVVKEIQSIYAVDTWMAYFKKVGYARASTWTPGKFCSMLRDRIIEARKRGKAYYPHLHESIASLAAKRQRLDKDY